MKLWSSILILFAALTFFGMVNDVKAQSDMPATSGAAVAVDDTTLGAEINRRFASDKEFAVMGIQVEVNQGVVELRGTVPSKTEADRAIEMARSVEGVQDVQSQLEVKKQPKSIASSNVDKTRQEDPRTGSDDATGTTMEPVTDSELKTQIESQLSSSFSDENEIVVDVKDGNVTLRGTVKNKTKENEILNLVGSVKGVKEVRSLLIPGQE